jgi:hypothetical protein
VDFCQVLTAAPKFQGRTVKTEIIVVPDYHGWFATTSQCNAIVINFAASSFAGSPALQKLSDQVKAAYRMREGPLPWKGVAVRVTARVDKVPAAGSGRPGYVLRLLDAENGRLVDIPREILQPPPSGGASATEPSREKESR